MSSASRVLLAVLLASVTGIAVNGCGRADTKPNPELKVPDIPPSNRLSKAPLIPQGK